MGVKVREEPKGSGIWYVFINHNGTRRAKKIGKDKRLAQEVARKVEAKLTLGDLNISQKKDQALTFGEYAKIWLAVTVPATCKRSTASDYQCILKKHILPIFDKKPVTEINRHMVKGFLMKKTNEGYAESTVTHIKNAISGVLKLAVDDEAISANPAQKLGKYSQTKTLQLGFDPLNREELFILLETFRQYYPRHYPMLLTLARTGMRIGEVLALQWGDIDFNGRFITVQRGISRGKIETPKNGKTRRVDMSKQLTEVLLDLRHKRKLETVKKGWGQVPEWVFVTERGIPLIANHWRNRVFDRALEKAGLRKIRVHDLRHSYASLLIQAGESLAYIRDQLGHHSIKVTVDIYGHLAPGGNKEAVDRLDDLDFDASKRKLSASENKKEASQIG